jgi:hypothetical protein
VPQHGNSQASDRCNACQQRIECRPSAIPKAQDADPGVQQGRCQLWQLLLLVQLLVLRVLVLLLLLLLLVLLLG